MAIGDTIFHLADKMAHGGARYMANRERKKKAKNEKNDKKVGVNKKVMGKNYLNGNVIKDNFL